MNKNILMHFALLAGGAMSLSAGPVSTLYMTAINASKGYIVQGNTATEFNLTGNQSVLAVGSTVRTLPYFTGTPGHEYTLGGVATGNTYTYPGGNPTYYDGTSDGTSNFTVDWSSGAVVRFASDWTGGQNLFTIAQTSSNLGIAYDGRNDSLWINNLGDHSVTNYAMNGTILTSFQTQPQLLALAFDSADSTLWGNVDGAGPGGVQLFYQYSTTGTLLSTASYANMPSGNNVRGMDFAPGDVAEAPEPATVTMFLAGFGLLAASRFRHKSRRS